MPNIDEAIEALLSYQQADMEGVMVLTSRQAIHEVADELKRVRSHAQHPAVWRVRYCGQWIYFEDKANAEIYAQGDDNTEPLYAAHSSDGGGESRPAPIGPQASAQRRSQELIGEAGVASSPSDSLTPAVQERLASPGSPERAAELQYEAGMYESLYLAWKERAERAEAQVENVRAKTIDECAKVIEPKGPRPCDCEPGGCYCHNYGDAQTVAAWDADWAAAQMIRRLSLSSTNGQPNG
jgi:hypothetical protein